MRKPSIEQRLALVAMALPCGLAWGQVSVLMNRYDKSGTGLNDHERILNTTNVNPQSFGKLYSYPVDGSVFAQPLYVPNVAIPNKGTHNVLYVATMNDTVYAFDAQANTTLWSVNFTNAAAGITPVPIADITGSNNLNIVGYVGIQSTPVIDAATGTMYLVARTKEVTGSVGNYVQRLHAIDIQTGAEKFGGPVEIDASVPGTGEQNSNGAVPFNPKMNNQRASLTLAGGQVIIAWASHEDDQPYHGWVMSYDAATLAQTGVFCVTPNGVQGGIWMSGRAPIVDSKGYVYLFTGNGTTDTNADFSEAALKLDPRNGLKVVDYFVASNEQSLNNNDEDLGSSAPILLPSANLLAGGGKQGVLYLLNPVHLGHRSPNDSQIPQKLQVTGSEIKPGPAYWESASKGPLLYLWGEQEYLNAWHFNGTTFDTAPVMQSTFTTPPGAPGSTITISSSGTKDGTGVVWASMAVSQDADVGVVPGMLRALNASDLTQELWNSQQEQYRNNTGLFAKFVPPVVTNGRVYMASFSDYHEQNYVSVFGLLPVSNQFSVSLTPGSATIPPGSSFTYTVSVNSPAGHRFLGDVALSILGLPSGATATFDPPSITGGGTSALTIQTASSTPLGVAKLTVSGQASKTGDSHSVSATLNVSNAAPTISMNFVGTSQPLVPAAVAGVIPKSNWNNLVGASGAATLRDDSGGGTVITATWAAQDIWSLPVANSPANFSMMQGYLDDLHSGIVTVSVSGLPLATNGYAVYVYADGDNGAETRGATYTLSAQGIPPVTLSLTDIAGSNFNGTFTQVTSSNAVGNYMVFAVPGGSFTLTGTPTTTSGFSLRAPVNGIQIIPQ